MQINRVALDLAKQVIQVHAVERSGWRIVGKSLKRAQVLPVFRGLPPCEVGMEACGDAHHWGRQLQAMGHRVKLLPPQYVKPRHPRATAPSWPEAQRFIHRPDIRSQSLPGS